MSLAEIHNLLSGEPGSNVTLSVVRARKAEPQKTVITRDIIVVPAVVEKTVEPELPKLKSMLSRKASPKKSPQS